MSRYILLEEKTTSSCSFVLIDIAAVIVGIYFLLDFNFEIHTVFKIIISLIGGGALFFLMNIKILKTIIIVIFSVLWAVFFTVLIESFFFANGVDKIWHWTIIIVSFVVSLVSHHSDLSNLNSE